jgi:glyoxylase-like metal-dependent hydrolase (beta-lactamase superfamily II)
MAGYLPLIDGLDLVIVYSHADWDHIWGTGGLPHKGAEIVGHRACRARFSADVPVTRREKQAAEPGRWDEVTLLPPSTIFDDGLVLDLGSLSLELRHLPGHTEDGIVGFVPERGLLLAGDAAETPLPVVPAGGPLARWIDELDRWANDPRVRTVVPAHGEIGGPAVIRRTADYLRGLLEGQPAEVAGSLTTFYRETHEANLRAWPSRTPRGHAVPDGEAHRPPG